MTKEHQNKANILSTERFGLNVFHFFISNWPKPGFEINACPRQAEIASGNLFFSLLCSTGKLTNYSVSNNIKQDYLEMQFRFAFVVITKCEYRKLLLGARYFSTLQSSPYILCLIVRTSLIPINSSLSLANFSTLRRALQLLALNATFSEKKFPTLSR